MFRLQGFVLELVTSQLCAFLSLASIVGSKDRNVFVRVRLLFGSSVTFCLTCESSAVNAFVFFRFVRCVFLHGACDYRIVQSGVSSCLLVISNLSFGFGARIVIVSMNDTSILTFLSSGM